MSRWDGIDEFTAVAEQASFSAGVSWGWPTITARSRSESGRASPLAREPKAITACTSGSAQRRTKASPDLWGCNPGPSSGASSSARGWGAA